MATTKKPKVAFNNVRPNTYFSPDKTKKGNSSTVNLKTSKRDFSPILARSASKFIQVSKPKGDRKKISDSQAGGSGTTDEGPSRTNNHTALKQINSAVTRVGGGLMSSNYNSMAVSQERLVLDHKKSLETVQEQKFARMRTMVKPSPERLDKAEDAYVSPPKRCES